MEKVEKVENVVDLSTNSASLEKFIWCRDEMCLVAVLNGNEYSGSPISKKWTKSGRMLRCYILYMFSQRNLTREVQLVVKPSQRSME